MYKLWVSTYKELLLLTRDLGGLAVLFIMPLLLVITITVIQDKTFKIIQENKIPILLVDMDKGNVSDQVKESLVASNLFEVIVEKDEGRAQNLVQTGTYQLAVILPQNLSKDLDLKIASNVEGILAKFGV